MKLALRPVDLPALRTDGGTQVHGVLNEAWVSDLAALYQEGIHDIPPISVVEEGETFWVYDGHHRTEALRRLGWGAIPCAVRCKGTADDARFFAAGASKSGLARSPEEKKRAVLMAVGTAAGRKLSTRDLARHVGVTLADVRRAVSGVETAEPAPTAPAPRKTLETLWARVDAALRADPSRENKAIAKELVCSDDTVRHRRAALGIPSRTELLAKGRAVAEATLKDHPDWTNARVGRASGISAAVVAGIRSTLGLPPMPAGGYHRPDDAPSAPAPLKRPDIRAAAEVIQLRPAPGISVLRVEALRFVERMNSDERGAFASDLAVRWPTVFFRVG